LGFGTKKVLKALFLYENLTEVGVLMGLYYTVRIANKKLILLEIEDFIALEGAAGKDFVVKINTP
jgi:hypothetical protein